MAAVVTKTKVNKNEGYVYFIKEFHSNTYKIGKTKNIENRFKLFSVKLPFEWEMVHHIKSKDYSTLEKAAHKFFADKRVNGEWFNLSDSDLEFIKRSDFSKRVKLSVYGKEERTKPDISGKKEKSKQIESNISFDFFAKPKEQPKKEVIKETLQLNECLKRLEALNEQSNEIKVRFDQIFDLEDELIASLKEENEMIRQYIQDRKQAKEKTIWSHVWDFVSVIWMTKLKKADAPTSSPKEIKTY